LLDEKTVDEASVEKMFADIDSRGLFVETLVLNAADQGLGQKIFENSLTDFMKVLNTNIVWNYCLSAHVAKRMKEQGGGISYLSIPTPLTAPFPAASRTLRRRVVSSD
jgi:short-subunit dehydrogenase